MEEVDAFNLFLASGILYLLIYLFINMLIALIPAVMARSRGRSQFGWFLFSVLISPIISIIILLCLGDTEKRRIEKISEEEEIRAKIRKQYN